MTYPLHLDNLAAAGAVGYGLLKGPRWVALAGGVYLLWSLRGTILTLLGQTPSTAQQVALLQVTPYSFKDPTSPTGFGSNTSTLISSDHQ